MTERSRVDGMGRESVRLRAPTGLGQGAEWLVQMLGQGSGRGWVGEQHHRKM